MLILLDLLKKQQKWSTLWSCIMFFLLASVWFLCWLGRHFFLSSGKHIAWCIECSLPWEWQQKEICASILTPRQASEAVFYKSIFTFSRLEPSLSGFPSILCSPAPTVTPETTGAPSNSTQTLRLHRSRNRSRCAQTQWLRFGTPRARLGCSVNIYTKWLHMRAWSSRNS